MFLVKSVESCRLETRTQRAACLEKWTPYRSAAVGLLVADYRQNKRISYQNSERMFLSIKTRGLGDLNTATQQKLLDDSSSHSYSVIYWFLQETQIWLSSLHSLWGWDPASWGILAVAFCHAVLGCHQAAYPWLFPEQDQRGGKISDLYGFGPSVLTSPNNLDLMALRTDCSDGHRLQRLDESQKPCVWEMTGPAGLQWASCPRFTRGGSIQPRKRVTILPCPTPLKIGLPFPSHPRARHITWSRQNLFEMDFAVLEDLQ